MLILRRLQYNFAVVAMLALCSCAAFAPAQSFDQKLAYAYGTHTAVLMAATSSLQAGSLSVSDAEQVLKMADQSRAVLDAARLSAGTGDLQTADGQLMLAVSVLNELQTYLRGRQKHGP